MKYIIMGIYFFFFGIFLVIVSPLILLEKLTKWNKELNIKGF